MTFVFRTRRAVLPVALAAGTALAIAGWYEGGPAADKTTQGADGYPDLFDRYASCPEPSGTLQTGFALEERARLLADRYAYNPRDGVRAVHHYLQAEDCYRSARAELSTNRAHQAGAKLALRVNTDYAAARLNLANALAREDYPVALSEIRRLLLLTEHVGTHDYVEWLNNIVGKVAARAVG
jgi:hypothetical protein